ncbi:MAG: fibronectin type III domain-containing protein [Bacteroidota bacterium]
MEYAFFSVAPGTNIYVATYTVDNTPPVITSVAAVVNANGTATITWTTDELTDSRVDYGTLSGSLTPLNTSNGSLATSHSITLSGLAPLTVYYFRVTSKDLLNNATTEPIPASAPLTFCHA